MKTLVLQKDLTWLGAIDKDLRVFDIVMRTEFGTTYNAYLLRGSEKNVLFETVKAGFTDDYFKALTSLISPEKIDYLVISHTEPDHSGSIERLLDLNPNLTVVGTLAAMGFLKHIVNRDFNALTVKDNDTLSLGDKTLRFFALPNLHWPDTLFTYVEEEGLLVTCDAFGAHFAHEGVLRSTVENEAAYLGAVQYYFDGILAPFKHPFVQNALDRVKGLSLRMILTGHGPVLDTGIEDILTRYQAWCAVPEKTKKLIVIPYVSAYGYTRALSEQIERGILCALDADVRRYDMVEADEKQVLSDLERADGILFGTPTIVGDALEPIWKLTSAMHAPIHGGKRATAFGSYGWSGEGVPNLLARLKQLRLKVMDEGLRVRFKPTQADLTAAFEFGKAFGGTI